MRKTPPRKKYLPVVFLDINVCLWEVLVVCLFFLYKYSYYGSLSYAHKDTQTHIYTPHIGMGNEIEKSTMRTFTCQDKARKNTYQLLLEAKTIQLWEKYFIV